MSNPFQRERDALVEEVRQLRKRLKLQEKATRHAYDEKDKLEADLRILYDLADHKPRPPKWLLKPQDPGLHGCPMTNWSDWHWGERVFYAQVGGVNEYNRRIAKARLRRLVETTVELLHKHIAAPNYPGLVVCLGGDMISGNIHEELRETNDGPVQECVLELEDEIIAALNYLLNYFPFIYVPCVPGNHGRMKAKPHAKNKMYESYEYNVYMHIKRYFKNDPRVHVDVPEEVDIHFNVLGHRFLLTHGDTLGVKGGDGIIGALGPIARGTMKVGRSEAQIGRDFDTLLIGHYHMYTPRGEGAPVIVNGTLKGYDEYARLFLRVPYSRPSQALWLVNQKHGVTFQWQVYLEGQKTSKQIRQGCIFTGGK